MSAGGLVAAGADLFARYAYPPNALGYCGPADSSVLLERRADETGRRMVAEHARHFEGAWTYLELIASAAGIGDPLDPRVVEAYWIGNDLLDGIDPTELMTVLQRSFPGQRGATWMPGRAHHSYHVFAVYPWVALLARGAGNGAPLNVLDQCRIRWGEVVGVFGERARIRSRPLVLDAGLLRLGSLREETAAWSVDGHSLLAASRGGSPVAAGDQVALHWDWVCDVLEPAQVVELDRRTAEQLARTNDELQRTSH